MCEQIDKIEVAVVAVRRARDRAGYVIDLMAEDDPLLNADGTLSDEPATFQARIRVNDPRKYTVGNKTQITVIPR